MTEIIIAFDVGDRRIGVAVSDPFCSYAMPLDTYFRTGDLKRDVAAVLSIAGARGATRIVLGLPLNADGTESVQTHKTRRFKEALEGETRLPIYFEDERYTTRAARQDLAFLGVSVKKDKKKKNVDSLAATYILEGYLEQLKKENSMKEERQDYDEENNIVELVDEDGSKHSFEHIMTFEYKGEWYCAFTPVLEEGEEEDEEGAEVIIFRLVGEEEDESLEMIDDDELLDEVFAEFCNQYEDFEDADEAAALEPDED